MALQAGCVKASAWTGNFKTFVRYSRVAALLLALVLVTRIQPISAQPTELTREQIGLIFLLLSGSGPSEETANNSAYNYYVANVSTQVVESICSGCHINGGLASSTNLIFSPGDDDSNLEAIRNYLQLRNYDSSTILAKVSGGLSHGGGIQLAAGSVE